MGLLLRPVARRASYRIAVAAGAAAGALAIFLSGVILAAVLITTGSEFRSVAGAVLLAHIPIMVVEGIVTGGAVGFLRRVRPEALGIDSTVNSQPTPSEQPSL